MNESCHVMYTLCKQRSSRCQKWVMSHLWLSHITTMNESRCIYEWVMSRNVYAAQATLEQVSRTSHVRRWLSHVTHMNVSCCTNGWIISHNAHVWMRHVTCMNESWHTYEWAMSLIWMSHVPRINESCHTYEWAYEWIISHHAHSMCLQMNRLRMKNMIQGL